MNNIFDISDGNLIFSNNCPLFSDVPLIYHKDDLREDINQITFKHIENLCIDIGWYGGDFESGTGFFSIMIVRDADWDNPLYKKDCKTVKKLQVLLHEALDYVKRNKDLIK
ncbi:hypothetical protein HYN59_13665 [Flavobacterium album]|uniref:Uncharacterized protein n=1 Tax=Flavobacterium album TaxID=2175091 RepID=A0A2S1R086_9FLAO|nr:hypothetical protein [Flavobacterium album]AWH86093.1 hypothetical protein HYN59_13665 [Flavobacterium album]